MNHVINSGKAFYWGTSEWSADDIIKAHGIAEKLGLMGPVMEQASLIGCTLTWLIRVPSGSVQPALARPL